VSTFSIADIKSRARLNTPSSGANRSGLGIFIDAHSGKASYDIYLAISNLEPEIIIGATLSLEDCGFSVCLDHYRELQNIQRRITRENAKALSQIIDRCNGMIALTTSAKPDSGWLNWECGYFEGKRGRVAILPITPLSAEIYRGEGVLGVYPFVTRYQNQNQKALLVVKFSTRAYCTLSNWFAGGEGLLE
jgi:hypothetical protein